MIIFLWISYYLTYQARISHFKTDWHNSGNDATSTEEGESEWTQKYLGIKLIAKIFNEVKEGTHCI